MTTSLNKLVAEHKHLWSKRAYVISATLGFILFASSLYANSVAVKIAMHDVGSATTDIILDNLPVVNTDIIFSEGALIFAIFTIVLLISRPKTIPFSLKAMALLVYTRSLFVILTHLAPYPDHISTDLDKFRYVTAGSDLFFSGHTALPFLFALMFWHIKSLRITFLACSVIAAGAVLLGHLHYSIDVFAAYFIVYGLYNFAQYILKTDFSLLKQEAGF